MSKIYTTYLYKPIIPCVRNVFKKVLVIPPVSKPFCACILVLIVSNGCPTVTLVVPYKTPTVNTKTYQNYHYDFNENRLLVPFYVVLNCQLVIS